MLWEKQMEQSGKEFSFTEKMAQSVTVLALEAEAYTAKAHRSE